MTSSGENGLLLDQMQVSKGQGQVSGRLSVLCWLAAPVATFFEKVLEFGNKVIVGSKVEFDNRVTI